MQRDLMSALVRWKSRPDRKPLILNGARQVGKTWLLKEFGATCFDSVAYVNLDGNPIACELFQSDYDIKRILTGLSLLLDMEISPAKTLIVLDEIQAEPRAITSLKYFCEQAPEYAVAAAGSLLGLSAHEGTGYPVGKVDTLDVHPMSFLEFMRATGSQRFVQLLEQGDTALYTSFSDAIKDELKRYYVVGGMPGVVLRYAQSDSIANAREVQNQILEDYARVFSKHIPARMLQKTQEVWNSIPAHLAQENKKFVFGRVRKGARAKDYEESLLWLTQAGLVRRVDRITKPAIPLSAYDDGRAFKVFLHDVGLLGAMSGLPPQSVLEGNRAFTEFKGALTEQYVCQQLIACGLKPFYWSAERSDGEIDFLVQRDADIWAIEVKAEENLRAKSLRAFVERYPWVRALRMSLSGFRDEMWMRNVPLCVAEIPDVWAKSRQA